MGVPKVGTHESGSAGKEPLCVQTQKILIPISGTLRITHEYVDVS